MKRTASSIVRSRIPLPITRPSHAPAAPSAGRPAAAPSFPSPPAAVVRTPAPPSPSAPVPLRRRARRGSLRPAPPRPSPAAPPRCSIRRRAGSLKFQTCGPNTTAAPYAAGSIMFWPPRRPSRLPPTNATSARPHKAPSSPMVSTRTTAPRSGGAGQAKFVARTARRPAAARPPPRRSDPAAAAPGTGAGSGCVSPARADKRP